MKISLKTFKIINFLSIFLLSFSTAISISFKNYILPVFLMVIFTLFLFFLRKKVKEVVADERDYEIAGKASLHTIQVFSWVLVILMFVFYYFQEKFPFFEFIAILLSGLVCLMLLIYSVIWIYLQKKSFFNLKVIISFIILWILIWVSIFTSIFLLLPEYENKYLPEVTKSEVKEVESFKIEKVLDITCEKDSECETPAEYLIRSNCPYTSKCIENKCSVICPHF